MRNVDFETLVYLNKSEHSLKRSWDLFWNSRGGTYQITWVFGEVNRRLYLLCSMFLMFVFRFFVSFPCLFCSSQLISALFLFFEHYHSTDSTASFKSCGLWNKTTFVSLIADKWMKPFNASQCHLIHFTANLTHITEKRPPNHRRWAPVKNSFWV